ncbi:hypothetical protein Tco_1097979 [Tanacetum coccineum]
MAESSQIQQQDQLERLASPIPFAPSKQVGFNLEDVIFNKNNEVALLYPKHTNKETFKCFLLNPHYGIYGKVGVNIFRNAIGAHYLPHSSEYVAPPPNDIVRPWFETIGYGEIKGLSKRVFFLLGGAKPVVFKAPKPSSNADRVPQGGFSKAPTGSKTSHLKRKKESISAMDSNLIHTLASTLVVAGMHQEDQQATGDPKSLGVTSEERANPQLSSGYDALTDFIAKANPRLYALNDSVLQQYVEQEEASRTIKLENLVKLMSHVQPKFKDLDSPKDDHIIVVDDSDENKEADKDEVHTTTNAKTKDALVPKPSSPRAQPSFLNIGELNELLVNSLQTEFSNILSTHDFSSLLPTKLKELSSKFNELTEEAITSKKTNDESVPSAGPAGTQPAEGEKNTNQATISQGHIKKDKGKKAMSLKEAEKESTNNDSDDDETHITSSMVKSSRIKKVKKFDFVTEGGKHIYLTEEKINQQKKIEEDAKAEAAKRKSEVRKEELVNLIGPEVVNKYYNDKLQYDRYYDKMLNRRAKSRITNCDVLTKNGLITLKLYREDSTSEVIPNFKASDLHLGEWREDPLNKLNDLANKKRKHADDIHDYFKANKRLKSSV